MKPVSVFLCGDSTVADYPPAQAPMAGWGQMLHRFFGDGVVIKNHAVNGRSSRSFFNEGRLDAIRSELGSGDYLLVQFGHNDNKPDEARRTEPDTTFTEYLKRYVDAARKHRAHPVLITPVGRRLFHENGTFSSTHGAYPEAMWRLGRELQVPVIDLTALSEAYIRQLGPEESKKLFVWLAPGECPNYPGGLQDNTHFCEYGALEMARLLAGAIQASDIGLKDYVTPLPPDVCPPLLNGNSNSM